MGEVYKVGKAMLEDRADRVVHDVVGIIGVSLAVPIFKFFFGEVVARVEGWILDRCRFSKILDGRAFCPLGLYVGGFGPLEGA